MIHDHGRWPAKRMAYLTLFLILEPADSMSCTCSGDHCALLSSERNKGLKDPFSELVEISWCWETNEFKLKVIPSRVKAMHAVVGKTRS
jgi:hypothetical protein